MGSKKTGISEVLNTERNFLINQIELVRPIVKGFDVLLAIAESDPILNGKKRERLSKRAKDIENEMAGMRNTLSNAKTLGGHIIPAVLAAASYLKSEAASVESACRTGNFQSFGWNSALDMFMHIKHKGEHSMHTINNGFAQDVPPEVKVKIMNTLNDMIKKWEAQAGKTAKRLEKAA